MEGKKEIEAKFWLPHPNNIRQRLLDLGGRMLVPRIFELNLRFDTLDSQLSANQKVLRLRRDSRTTLTFKYSHNIEERVEIEIEVNNFQVAQSLLQALGYDVVFTYEKYRETFILDPTHIMFDELPFGHFVEIESSSLEMVEQATTVLGLDWEARIKQSYTELFKVLAQDLDLPFTDATFSNFANMKAIQPADIGVEYAIRSPSTDESET
jgi:adenylate cyclase class 2